MRDFFLLPDEKQLALSLAEGRPADFSKKDKVVIRAEAVRRLLLGQPVRLEEQFSPVCVEAYGPGLHLIGATVTGKLELAHACSKSGSPVSLALERCDIPEEIDLCGANLQRLSMRGSKITHLRAIGLRVVGGLDLCALTSAWRKPTGEEQLTDDKKKEEAREEVLEGADGEDLCWVELNGAEIGGSVNVSSARLVAPKARPNFVPYGQPARFALNLAGATIGHDLILRRHPEFDRGFRAIGGVSIDGARIGNGLLADGAVIRKVELVAINAQNARIEGSCLLRATHRPDGNCQRFRASGSIRLAGAKIGGTLEMTGAILHGDLSLETIEVRRTAMLKGWDSKRKGVSHLFPFLLRNGNVVLSGAKFNSGVEMHGARIEGKLEADDVQIGGDASLCAFRHKRKGQASVWPFSAEKVSFAGASITGDLDLSGAALAGEMNAQNIQVGQDVYLCRGPVDKNKIGKISSKRDFEGQGTIDFSRAKVAGKLDLTHAKMGAALLAKNVEIGGDVLLINCAALPKRDEPAEQSRPSVRAVSGAKAKAEVQAAKEPKAGAKTVPRAGRVVRAWFKPAARAVEQVKAENEKKTISLDGAVLAKSLKVALSEVLHVGWPEKVSLIDASVEVLEDEGGKGWGKTCTLKLRGFRYARLSDCDERDEPGNWFRRQGLRLQARLDFSRVALLTSVLVIATVYVHGWPWLWLLLLSLGLWIYGGLRFKESPAHRRLAWLKLQYKEEFKRPWLAWLGLKSKIRKPTLTEYFPDPYERLTKAFREEGDYNSARQVTSARLSIERQQTQFVQRKLLLLYAWGFDYGLSPARALGTFLACVAFGALAACVADHGYHSDQANDGCPLIRMVFSALHPGKLDIEPVLMMDANPVATVALQVSGTKPDNHFEPRLLKAMTDNNQLAPDEFECGDQVEPLLYALDVFVPALELHQQEKCSVSTKPEMRWWRRAQAVYSILGWIVTSLTVLTVSGILRRQVEA